jgi:hypothetical protein
VTASLRQFARGGRRTFLTARILLLGVVLEDSDEAEAEYEDEYEDDCGADLPSLS